MTQLENVTVLAQSNVYFDGKCVSHTVLLADGSQKSVGVILPSSLRFNTAATETMQITAGSCRVRLADADWVDYTAGTSFDVPADSYFDIETTDGVDYICHYG